MNYPKAYEDLRVALVDIAQTANPELKTKISKALMKSLVTLTSGEETPNVVRYSEREVDKDSF